MALPDWPSLPYDPDMTQFSRQPARAAIVTTPESGPDLGRQRSNTLLIRVPRFAIALTSAQHATWLGFWESTLSRGQSHFMMSVLLEGRTFVTRRCYIEGLNYADEPLGLRWLVSFPLVIFRNASS